MQPAQSKKKSAKEFVRRVPLRFRGNRSKEHYELICKAADISETSLNKFIIKSAKESALKIISEHEAATTSQNSKG